LGNPQTNLSELATQFVAHKKAMGKKYETGAFYLNSFIKFADTTAPGTALPDKVLVSAWCETAAEHPGNLYNMTTVIREFGKYLHVTGYDTAYVIPPKRGNRLEPHLPYFFTRTEIETFFIHCDDIRAHKERPGWELVVPAFFRLLYCCGLRCREARILRRSDVNLGAGYIDVTDSKGPYSRRIFLDGELAAELTEYDSRMSVAIPGREYFFAKNRTKHYGKLFAYSNFNRIWRTAFPGFSSPIKPRAYDFRHHFAYANLNRWAKQGKDVNVMLAYLMKYMGHRTIRSTLYYFHLVPAYFDSFREKSESLEQLLPEVSDEEQS
jgi:integrase